MTALYDSKDRLKDISHHFLGGSVEGDSNGVEDVKPVVFLPVLLESDEQDAFVYGINSFLNTRTRSSLVINVDSAFKEGLPVDNKLDLELTKKQEINRKRIFNHLKSLDDTPDLCLLPFVSSKISLLRDNDFLLVVVPASLKGVRKIFRSIEELCSGLNNMTVGVVVTYANSLQMSQLCYDVIANSLENFLDVKPVLLGHLLSDTAIDLAKGSVIKFSDDVDKIDSAPIELDDITENIWHELTVFVSQDQSINNLNPTAADGNSDFTSISA